LKRDKQEREGARKGGGKAQGSDKYDRSGVEGP